MKIALVQFNSEWEAKEANYKRAEVFIKRASSEACDVAVFPEMFNTGFSNNIPAIAEQEDGETVSFLSSMAKENGIYVIAGFPVLAPDGVKGQNRAVVMDRRGELVAKYTKIYPFSFTNEEKYFIKGNETVTFQIDDMPSSLFICYDLRFPEVFRPIAKKVQAIFIIANWPTVRKEPWEHLLKARAIENLCFVIGVNRIGSDGNRLDYPGASHVFDPLGMDLSCGSDSEEFLTCEFDPDEVMKARRRFPFLNDIRPCNIS
jgi:predicted amidohydrolase